MKQPLLSIIIPTHNRRAQVLETLRALAAQSWPMAKAEVIVVADACEDDTVEQVRAYGPGAPFRLLVLAHSARSAARTRNYGVQHASSPTLLFLDDDVIPCRDLVRAHVQAQRDTNVVLGYSKPMVPARASWFQRDARRWWEDTYREIGRSGHRFTYRDFFSGNVSMPTSLFRQLEGFDETITGRLEDYELGVRLLKAGARFVFEPAALGFHHDYTDLEKWLLRIRMEGVADIQIGQRHPELRSQLFGHFETLHGRWTRLLRDAAFISPMRGAKPLRYALALAGLLEALRMRRTWQRTVRAMRKYNYWRGTAGIIGSKRQLLAWLQEAPLAPPMASDAVTLDLAALPIGDDLAACLAEGSQKGVRLLLNGYEMTTIPPQPGAEPLRVEHLRAELRALARREFVPGLAIQLAQSMQGSL